MLTITKTRDGGTLTVYPQGRLDTITADEFETEVNEQLEGVTELVIDCAGLEYISSAGLRVLLSACKAVSLAGSHVIVNCSDTIMGIFQITKLEGILNIR